MIRSQSTVHQQNGRPGTDNPDIQGNPAFWQVYQGTFHATQYGLPAALIQSPGFQKSNKSATDRG